MERSSYSHLRRLIQRKDKGLQGHCSSSTLTLSLLSLGLQHFIFAWLQQFFSWWFLPHFSSPLTPKWKFLNLNVIISGYPFVYQIILPEFLASVANCSWPLKSILSFFLDTHSRLQPQLETTFPSFLCDYVVIWLNSYQWNKLKWYIHLPKRKLLP